MCETRRTFAVDDVLHYYGVGEQTHDEQELHRILDVWVREVMPAADDK